MLLKPILALYIIHYITLSFQVVEIIGGGGGNDVCPPPPQYFHGGGGGRLPPAPQDRRLWQFCSFISLSLIE